MSICAENITWKAGKKVIVNNVSLRVPRGETVGLLGPNGCGKSSLLRVLAGLRRPDAGRVTLDGQDIARMAKKQLARRVAFVEQHGMTEANMRVRDVVRLGRIPHHSPFSNWSAQDDEAIAAALQRVAMLEKSEQGWLSLSGGERQRVHIARALAQSPSEILLDRDAAGADPRQRDAGGDFVRRAAVGRFPGENQNRDLPLPRQKAHSFHRLGWADMPLFSLRPAATLWPPVLLGSQFVFNIGFYAVVPFLALFLRDDMLLSGGLIGLILGLRTFSQQGMFILGGTLADRYGAKAIILAGCVVRVAGFLLLACGASLWPIILGACLTGVGGALFSPSIEALLARAGTHSQANGKRSRAEWFALFAVCGELGAVIGPVAGGVLSGIGFRHIALAGAGIFLLALAVLFFCLPADGHTTTTRRRVPWWTPLRQPRFVAFILAYSSWLLSYNQLYLALPVEIQRSGGREQDLAPLFMLASLLIITLQLPLARFARRMGAVRILPVGFLLLSASFASVALFAAAPPAEGWLRLMPAAGFVTLLTLGQMLLVPAAKDLIPLFAEESTLGAHYGALATAGGCAVLAGNLLLGHLLDQALIPSPQAVYPWLLLALFPLCSAVALRAICRPLAAT